MTRHRCSTTPLLLGVIVSTAFAAGCTKSSETPQQQRSRQNDEHPVVARGPGEGTELWLQPTSREDLGEGALINVKIDRISVPYTTMMVATQTLAASGIPVHLHTFEDELIYVVSGRGSAIVGNDRQEVALEPGSVVYIPTGQWHGLRNADPNRRMAILLVTTPSSAGGLGDFFRSAAVRPGHPPLDLSEEEFLALISQYGMRVPDE